ncbi:MAG: NAD(+) synthase [Tannerella sp.]|jgi:NAD+ synthase (glutamine-hydrolysing)|nr:NAD(+) synthase [Tannerella sp.]
MNGFVKVAAASPIVEVGNCSENIKCIEALINQADIRGVQILVFPELCITGYTCMDLFAQKLLLDNAVKYLLQLVANVSHLAMLCVVGMPLEIENKLFNVAVAFQQGKILGIVPKTYIPNHKEFQEMRWFSSGSLLGSKTVKIGGEVYPVGCDLLFRASNNDSFDYRPETIVGVEICEDLWTPVPPSSFQSLHGASIILNLSASNEITGKNEYLQSLIVQQSARCIAGYVYASSGFGESTTDLVFAGKGFVAENGVMTACQAERFTIEPKLLVGDIDVSYLRHDRLVNTSFGQSSALVRDKAVRFVPFQLPFYKGALSRSINPHPFVPSDTDTLKERCEEILNIQTYGLIKRLKHIIVRSAVIGVSGGLDSTLALMVTVRAFDRLGLPRTGILGVTMPGFGTTDRTYNNAVKLIRSLGVTFREISIKDACIQHFKDIGHDGKTPDVTYENVQARERTQILMDLANMTRGIVIGTGDMSELALGWATYNGDHISMYGVNASVPKTLVRYLVESTATFATDDITRETLLDIAATPVSPELIPADEQGNITQKTEDIMGPYELHDFFLYHFIRRGAEFSNIYFLACRAFEYKYDGATIRKWLQVFLLRFFSQQFKRSCLPDGPKVGSISLSPRCDWRMPSDAADADFRVFL